VSNRLAMAREGSQYTDSVNGFSLSWPHGGIREVVELSPDKRPQSVRLRIANGSIVETDLAVTGAAEPVAEYRLLTGEEARRHKAVPAGRVVPHAEYERYGEVAIAFHTEQGAIVEEQRVTAAAEADAAAAAIEAEAQAKVDAQAALDAEALAVAEAESEAKPMVKPVPDKPSVTAEADKPAIETPDKPEPPRRGRPPKN